MADDGEGIQALLVSVDGKKVKPDGFPYHITWSLDTSQPLSSEIAAFADEDQKVQTYKPQHSNALIALAQRQTGQIKFMQLQRPLPICVQPVLIDEKRQPHFLGAYSYPGYDPAI
jgi:hypothetical protein